MGEITECPQSLSILAHNHSRFQIRTLEILDSFGVGERVWKEANHMLGKKPQTPS